MDTQTIQNMIDTSIAKAVDFKTTKRGDTPTDALQLANKKYVDSKSVIIYGGLVHLDGTAGTPFPSGWTSSVGTGGGTGQYTITHNLGTSSYIVNVTTAPIGSLAAAIANITAQNTNSFTVIMLQQTGAQTWAGTDTEFTFTLLQTTQ